MTNNLIIYRETNKNPDKKIKYYKKLGIKALLYGLDAINEDSLEILFEQNKHLSRAEIGLIVEIDLEQIISLLLSEDRKTNYRDPKIRKSLYQFINYLTKHGIGGLYFRNLQALDSDNQGQMLGLVRELIKNTSHKKDLISLAHIKGASIDLARHLSNEKAGLFSYVNYDFGGDDFLSTKESIRLGQSLDKKTSIRQTLSIKNSLAAYTNIKNYPFKSHSLMAGATYMLRGAPLINDFEELGIYNFEAGKNEYNLLTKSSETLDFYRKLFAIRNSSSALRQGTFRMIFEKDKDVLSYIRTYGDEKVLVFANFSKSEMLVDIRFHFLDLSLIHI